MTDYKTQEEKVLGQLELIKKSDIFRKSRILSDFLDFIVKERLQNENVVLKEYTIGIEVLKKPSEFDPQLDSVVRIHAGRLRRALKEYYFEVGAHDLILISVPLGGYLPTFVFLDISDIAVSHSQDLQEPEFIKSDIKEIEHNLKNKERAEFTKPVIVLAPFKIFSLSDSRNYLPISHFLSSELSHYKDFQVVNFAHFSNGLIPDYTINGSIQIIDEHIRVFIQLLEQTGKQLWGQVFEKEEGKSYWRFEDEVITKTLAAVAGFGGVISKNETRQKMETGENCKRILSHWYSRHQCTFDPNVTQQAQLFYKEFSAKFPENAEALAFLADTMAAQAQFSDEERKLELLMYSEGLCKTSLELDFYCKQAYFSLALIRQIQGNFDESQFLIDKGITMNPRSADYMCRAGSLLIFQGEYEKGVILLNKYKSLIPVPSWQFHVAYSLYFLVNKKYKEAADCLIQVNSQMPLISILLATYFYQSGQKDVAKKHLKNVLSTKTELLGLEQLIDNFFYDVLIALEIRNCLNALGAE